MARVPLVSAAYAGQSVIASGQECVNLYAEINVQIDPQAPSPVTYYQTPGTALFANPFGYEFNSRGCYRTSVGTAFYVVKQNVYFVGADRTLTLIGVIADRNSKVYFKDNGLAVVLVDGVNGYVIDMTTNDFAKIVDPNFYGADFVELLDTFFIFNRPATNQFFITASNASYGQLSSTAIQSGTIVGGAAYTNGVYQNVPLTGGSGSNATATITVAGAVVTVVAINNSGMNYVIGDVLSAAASNIGGTGAGFTYTITATASAFDPLDIAAKAGFNDPIVGIANVHRELWLIGNLTTEVWIGTGAADFFFQQVQGAYINHGSAAQYSIAVQDVLVFFIQQDMQGNGLVLQGQGYDVTEISTPRIVKEFKSYATLADAIGFCFQISDHAFYALVFPTASKGWLYDLGTKQWSEWNYVDDNGNFLRPRVNNCMFAFGLILGGDWENGNLLIIDNNTFVDYTNLSAINPIVRVRTFPHMTGENYQRITYTSFDADMEVGTIVDDSDPQVSLSWSDNRGVSYGNPVTQSMGKLGETLTTISWNRLGQARDRVFKVSWSDNLKTALNGGFVETKVART